MAGRRSVSVRMAKNDDGPEVERLMAAVGFFQFDGWEIDWSDLEPNWLVGVHSGSIVGCIQVVPARPFGRIECLCVDPELSTMMKYAVTSALTTQAAMTVKMYGAQAVTSLIPYSLPSYFGGAMNRGWFELDEGHIVMRRLR